MHQMNTQTIIVVNDYAYIQGGADAVAISSAIGLSKQSDYRIVFFSGVGPVSNALIEAGVKVICVGKKDILHEKNRIKAAFLGLYDRNVEILFRELLNSYNNSDTLIHVHTWTKALTSVVFKVASELNFKTVLTLHDFFSICPNGGLYNYKQKHICYYKPLSLRCLTTNCDLRSYPQKIWRVTRQAIQSNNIRKISNLYLLSVSKKVADEVLKYFPVDYEQLFYLHNPIEVLDDEKIDIKSKSKYLFMGRLAEEKGPELFCQALTDLGLQGVVVGDGYMKEDLIKKYPNIYFAGWLSGKKKYEAVKECCCFVMTSRWYETFGLVVAEMKALGMPSIVPAESAAAEQIEDLYNGFYFKTGDIDSLKEAIHKFENSDKINIQCNVINSFHSDQFSTDAHVKKIIGIYSSILNDNRV